jgi:hypothetical protein
VCANKGFIMTLPAPALVFQGRRIAWALTAQKLLLEFQEEVRT